MPVIVHNSPSSGSRIVIGDNGIRIDTENTCFARTRNPIPDKGLGTFDMQRT